MQHGAVNCWGSRCVSRVCFKSLLIVLKSWFAQSFSSSDRLGRCWDIWFLSGQIRFDAGYACQFWMFTWNYFCVVWVYCHSPCQLKRWSVSEKHLAYEEVISMLIRHSWCWLMYSVCFVGKLEAAAKISTWRSPFFSVVSDFSGGESPQSLQSSILLFWEGRRTVSNFWAACVRANNVLYKPVVFSQNCQPA